MDLISQSETSQDSDWWTQNRRNHLTKVSGCFWSYSPGHASDPFIIKQSKPLPNLQG